MADNATTAGEPASTTTDAATIAEHERSAPSPVPERIPAARPTGPPVVLVLSGLPGAGKTTLAKALCDALWPHAQHVCFDDVIDDRARDWAAAAAEVPGEWRASREDALTVLTQALQRDFPPALIVVDDNMYYRSMRHRVRQLARDHAACFAQAHVACDLALAERRNAARPHAVPFHVLRRMAGRLEPPSPDDVPWEALSVTVPAADPTLAQVAAVEALLGRAREAPLTPYDAAASAAETAASRTITATSAVHQLDVRVRRQITHLMNVYKGEGSLAHTRALSQALCDMRRAALDEARGAISSGAAFEMVADRVAQQLATAVEKCADGPLK